jgi:hypothetical protein
MPPGRPPTGGRTLLYPPPTLFSPSRPTGPKRRRKRSAASAFQVESNVGCNIAMADAGVCGSRGASFDCKSQVEWSSSIATALEDQLASKPDWFRLGVSALPPSHHRPLFDEASSRIESLHFPVVSPVSPHARTWKNSNAPRASGAPDICVVSCAWWPSLNPAFSVAQWPGYTAAGWSGASSYAEALYRRLVLIACKRELAAASDTLSPFALSSIPLWHFTQMATNGSMSSPMSTGLVYCWW